MKSLIIILLISNAACASIPNHKAVSTQMAGPSPVPRIKPKTVSTVQSPRVSITYVENNYYCGAKK